MHAVTLGKKKKNLITTTSNRNNPPPAPPPHTHTHTCTHTTFKRFATSTTMVTDGSKTTELYDRLCKWHFHLVSHDVKESLIDRHCRFLDIMKPSRRRRMSDKKYFSTGRELNRKPWPRENTSSIRLLVIHAVKKKKHLIDRHCRFLDIMKKKKNERQKILLNWS